MDLTKAQDQFESNQCIDDVTVNDLDGPISLGLAATPSTTLTTPQNELDPKQHIDDTTVNDRHTPGPPNTPNLPSVTSSQVLQTSGDCPDENILELISLSTRIPTFRSRNDTFSLYGSCGLVVFLGYTLATQPVHGWTTAKTIMACAFTASYTAIGAADVYQWRLEKAKKRYNQLCEEGEREGRHLMEELEFWAKFLHSPLPEDPSEVEQRVRPLMAGLNTTANMIETLESRIAILTPCFHYGVAVYIIWWIFFCLPKPLAPWHLIMHAFVTGLALVAWRMKIWKTQLARAKQTASELRQEMVRVLDEWKREIQVVRADAEWMKKWKVE